jgi:hypothetical protein
MNAEDTEAMQALDHRLRKIFSDLDAAPGFEQRLQARIATHALRPTADELAQLERQHHRARAAADRAARVDSLAIAIAGVGSLVAVWRFAPGLARLYAASVETLGLATIGVATLAIAGAALWAVLRQFDVDPRRLVGA